MNLEQAYVVTPFPILEKDDLRPSDPDAVVKHAKVAGTSMSVCGQKTLSWNIYMDQLFRMAEGTRCLECRRELLAAGIALRP